MNSVVQAARPVFRAAAGPLLRGWRRTFDVAVCAGEVLQFDRDHRTVVDDNDAQVTKGGNQPLDSRNVVSHRDDNRDVDGMTRATRRPGMGHRRVEQGTGQLGAGASSHLEATVAHPRPPSGPSHLDVTVIIPVRNNIPESSGWCPRCATCAS